MSQGAKKAVGDHRETDRVELLTLPCTRARDGSNKQYCCKENLSRKCCNNNNNNNRFLQSNNLRFCKVIIKVCQLQFSLPKAFPLLCQLLIRECFAIRSHGRKVTCTLDETWSSSLQQCVARDILGVWSTFWLLFLDKRWEEAVQIQL